MSNDICNFDAGEVFSGRKTGNFILGRPAPNPVYTPTKDPSYVYPRWAPDLVAWHSASATRAEPMYIFGPTGCGKTSCIKQVFASVNYLVYEITGHSRLEFPDLAGHHTIVDGNMQFQYGPLALAMKYGGLFLMNEIDLLDPSVAAGLNSVLDGSALVIPENNGEVIPPHPLFRFIATANSNGTSDTTGLYQGILRQNLAFMDRFILLKADYLPAEVEKAIVMAHVGKDATGNPILAESLVDKMLLYAKGVRQRFTGEDDDDIDNVQGQLDITFSTRTLIRWARLAVQCQPLAKSGVVVMAYALDRALRFRASPASKATLDELYQRIFDDTSTDDDKPF